MTYLICLLSGLVTALPFLVPSLWLLPWISIIPLFYLAPRVKFRYLHGLFFGMGFYLPLYYWFIKLYPMDFIGFSESESILTILICWFGLALLQASEMAFIPMVYARFAKPRAPYSPLVAAACFTIFEWAQSLGWTGVPWGRLAITQMDFLPMVQSASLLGSLFICFLIALTNGILVQTLPMLWGVCKPLGKHPLKKRVLYAMLACSALLIPLVNAIGGSIRLSALADTMEEAQTVRVAAIQGNIASGDKWADNSVKTSLEKYLSLSESVINEASPDILVWPETVLTTTLRLSKSYYYRVSDFAKHHGVTIIVGAYDRGGENDEERYNALYAFYPDGTCDENVYRKRHLVPFGEYLPMAWLFENIPFLADLNLLESSLTPGTDSLLFDSPYGTLGGLICFDSIYDTLARDSVRDGASLLLLSTNDSWYRDSHAIYQHNAHAQLRAIENGRAIARAANTGVSTMILPNGEVTALLAPLTDGTIYADLPLMQIQTPYQTLGNLIVPISFAILFSIPLCRILLTCYRKNRRS